MKNIKEKAAPAIVWEKGDWPCEWAGSIGGKPVFEIRDDGALFFIAGYFTLLGRYSASRSAKRGAERFVKQMREIFAEDGK